MQRRGFTLIEVMVVLSILAIIAILGYNFFGAMVKEAVVKNAAIKLTRDAELFDRSLSEYYRKTGTYPAITDYASRVAWYDEILDMGLVREIPAPPGAEFLHPTSPCGNNASPGGASGYELRFTNNLVGKAANDVLVKLHCMNEEICLAFNELHGNGSVIPADYWNVENYGGKLCSESSDPNVNYQLVWVAAMDVG